MVDNPHEAGEFATVASAVLINLGTPYDDTVAAMREAVTAAARARTPELNKILGEAVERNPPPSKRGNASFMPWSSSWPTDAHRAPFASTSTPPTSSRAAR